MALPDPLLEALRVEPEPVDDLTRARWLARLSPQLDAIDEARKPRSSRRAWLALAAVGAAAIVAIALWPRHAAQAPAVALERARLHPYVVAGVTADAAATTLLAGRFARLDVGDGELVRAELDGDRLAALGPARVEVTAATTESAELTASGTLLVDARAGRPLVIHAGALALRAQHAVFAARTSDAGTVVFVDRGMIELGGAKLGAGEWYGPQGARSAALVTALREHAHAIAPVADGGIVAIAGSSPVATASGDALATAPLWARMPIGSAMFVIAAAYEQRVGVTVRAGEVARIAQQPAAPLPEPAPLPVPPSRPSPVAPTTPPRPVGPIGTVSPASPAGPHVAATSPPPAAPELDASALYARAEAELARGDRDAAEASWTELLARFPDAPQVASALYDLARLARSRGDLARARDDLARLAAAKPPAVLAEPARYLACRLDVEAADLDAAARCFGEFRASFPRSTHDAEVLAWLAGRAREVGGCAAARELAAEYVRRYPRGPFAAHARECEAR